MMHKLDISQLKGLAQDVIKKHQPMMSLYQTLAENFYPERADFTNVRNLGDEISDNLVDSYPVLVRRDLGDSLSAMLRDGDWFEVGVTGDDPDHTGKLWLEWATKRMKHMFDHREANFTRATKEGDHDFVTFGSCVISVEVNKKHSGLLFRAWHIRDCSWFEDETGQVCGVVRKWKPQYREMISYFGEDKVHTTIKESKGKDAFKLGEVRHMVIPSELYGDEDIKSKHPYVSIFIDVANEHIMEAVGIDHKFYVIPRFKTIPNSPFAYSPATMIGLPDARSVQQMQHTLLEAGERYTRPPLIATSKVIRSDVDLSPDGITWVDDEYDEKKGASLRPIDQNSGGFPIGLEMKGGIMETLRNAFYTNKLSLPDTSHEMTAYEVSERVKQWRRENLPLLAPIESEYNGQLCEMAFDVSMNAGFLGSPQDIPDSLSGKDVRFIFESPLSISVEQEKVNMFNTVIDVITKSRDIDPNCVDNINLDQAIRDAMTGSGAPEEWQNDPKVIEQIREARVQQIQEQMAMEQQQGAQAQGQQPQQAVA